MPNEAPFPSKETEVNEYFQLVQPYLLANKVRFAITGANVIKLTDDFAAWNGVFPASQDPNTRTKTITKSKTTALKNMKTICRAVYADIPKSTLTTTDRLTLGLRGRGKQTRAHVMKTAPLITLKKYIHLEHILQLQNPETPASTAMPTGQVILLQYYVGAPGLKDVDIIFSGVEIVTRATNIIGFTYAQVGQTCYYRACYQNTHKERGPLSATLRVIVT
jgi:hypothetical protein